MKTLSRILITLLTSACVGGVSNVESEQSIFTVQVVKRTVDGQARAALMLCQSSKCVNPLRNNDGSEFYFHNHAKVYNSAAKSIINAKAVELALSSVMIVASATGIYYLIRNWRVGEKVYRASRAKVDDSFADLGDAIARTGRTSTEEVDEVTLIRKIDENGNEVYVPSAQVERVNANDIKDEVSMVRTIDENGNEVHVSAHVAESELERYSQLEEKYFRNAIISAGIAATALLGRIVQHLSNDVYWKDKEQVFEKLFVHGHTVKLSTAEVIALLEAITKNTPAVLDAKVRNILY